VYRHLFSKNLKNSQERAEKWEITNEEWGIIIPCSTFLIFYAIMALHDHIGEAN
jgi:hypothetical protein